MTVCLPRSSETRNSAQVIVDHVAMLLLLQQGHSKPSMLAAPDVGWMAPSASLLVAGSLLCFVFRFSTRRPVSLFFPIVFLF